MKRNQNNLTPLQQEVVDAYLQMSVENRSAKTAYLIVRPNSKETTAETEGPKILRNPQVRLYLDKVLTQVAAVIKEATSYDMTCVVEDLIEIKDMCMGKREIIVNFKDTLIRIPKGDAECMGVLIGQAIKALELLGKHFRGFAGREEVNTLSTFPVIEVSADLSPEEWHRRFE